MALLIKEDSVTTIYLAEEATAKLLKLVRSGVPFDLCYPDGRLRQYG